MFYLKNKQKQNHTHALLFSWSNMLLHLRELFNLIIITDNEIYLFYKKKKPDSRFLVVNKYLPIVKL